MTSMKTGDIALRLWKLKASAIQNMEVVKNININDTLSNASDDEELDNNNLHDDFRNTYEKDYLPNEDDAAEETSSNEENSCTVPSPIDKKNEMKPTQSYIALIATAILKSKDQRLVLSDIYKYIMEKHSYFQSQDKSWRNSIRHNLSLNECFIKVGRSEQGKGHYWAIHPANYEDFSQGDFRRRRARRRVRRSFLDTHPYAGYPLRPYANLPRPRYFHDGAYKPNIEFQRHIYPMFYESNYYPSHKLEAFTIPLRNKIIHSGNKTEIKDEAKQQQQQQQPKNNCIKNNIGRKSTNVVKPLKSPKKMSPFSIDNILGNKLNEVQSSGEKTMCTNNNCICTHSGELKEKYFPYYYRDTFKDTKLSSSLSSERCPKHYLY